MLDCFKVTKQLNLFFLLHCLFLLLILCLCRSDCSVFADIPHGAPPDAGLSASEAHSDSVNIFVHKVIFLLHPDTSTAKKLFL